MKIKFLIVSILLLVSGISAVSAAATITATNPWDAGALVYVSGYEISPQVFYPGETGTVTVHVTNAANASVSVSQPNLLDPHVHVNNQGAYATSTNIGPGATADYSFIITVNANDGTYFPLFTVSPDFYTTGSIHSTIKLKVDSTDVRASISKKPDTFSVSKKDTVNVSVVNSRLGDISDVLIMESDSITDAAPAEKFIGVIPAGGSVEVPFQVTPAGPDTLVFNITFRNGDNHHATSVVLPLNIGEDKTAAQIVVNNIESSASGTTNTMKGDVTNNGLSDAKSVLVTVGSPATPANPNPVYALGNLAPDDFSSFEVTYTSSGPGAIPLLIEYKDADGTVFKKTFSISTNTNTGIPGSSGMSNAAAGSASGSLSSRRGGLFGSFGSGFGQIPVTEIVIGLVAIIALIVAWRKGLLKKIADKFRKTRNGDLMPPEQEQK
jgi:hypothetical protein